MSEIERESEQPGKSRPGKKKWSDVVSSSRQVWLAGLGALVEAEAQGSKALDTLVARGQEVERWLARDAEAGRARRRVDRPFASTELARPHEKLGLLFEQRVARAIDRLGMRPPADVAKLEARVERLSAKVEALTRKVAASADTEKSDQTSRAT